MVDTETCTVFTNNSCYQKLCNILYSSSRVTLSVLFTILIKMCFINFSVLLPKFYYLAVLLRIMYYLFLSTILIIVRLQRTGLPNILTLVFPIQFPVFLFSTKFRDISHYS